VQIMGRSAGVDECVNRRAELALRQPAGRPYVAPIAMLNRAGLEPGPCRVAYLAFNFDSRMRLVPP